MADSAVDVRGNKLTNSMKPQQPDQSSTGKPRNQRFIGLLIAYVLITLLVVYMVVCAVCFQPRNCKPCLCHKFTLQHTTTAGRSRGVYCVAETPATSTPDPPRPRLNHADGHFSRSIGSGERFLQETSSLELLAPHALTGRATCGHPSPVGAWQMRRDLRPVVQPPPMGNSSAHRESLKCFETTPSMASSSKLVHRVENRQTPVVYTKVAC
ncbi:unnamed protein product [Schistocephalus solidus]|uniref:Uncharacterized protein n=1 Tax=Schistocephalus solidus TaxID=70667 RepID=A0A183SJI9_SCHSO|nr:unnamed protein product [Schistocephalus solidus]